MNLLSIIVSALLFTRQNELKISTIGRGKMKVNVPKFVREVTLSVSIYILSLISIPFLSFRFLKMQKFIINISPKSL
jgi:hypothetical protein